MFLVAMLRETQPFVLKFISTNTANVADVLLIFIYQVNSQKKALQCVKLKYVNQTFLFFGISELCKRIDDDTEDNV